MIEPKPIAESQFARISGDPWAAVRRIASGSHYEALGETAFPGSDLPSDEPSRSAVGFLCGALLAQAALHVQEAEALFARCLELLADRRPSEDLWIRLTAFAAIGSAESAAAFEAFLAGHDMLDVAALAALALPARSNFLGYCVKHGRLGYALGLVEQAMPNGESDGISLEAWGFRLAALPVLDHADRRDQFAVCASACEHMLQSGQVDPLSMRPAVEVLFAVRLAEAARNQGDARSTIANYRRAIALIERGPAPGLSRALLVNLLQRLARFHQSVRYFPETQRCLERSIGAAAVEGYKYDLVAGFFALANALEREGRYPDAVTLQARRVAVMENDQDFPPSSRQSARHDLARALLANGDAGVARRILTDVIAFARNEPSYDQALLFSSLLSRAEANLAQGGSAAAAWHDVNAIFGLQGLSANQQEQVSRYLLHTASAAGQKPPRDLVDRFGELAEQMPHVTAAVIAAHGAAVLLRYYGDSSAAENFIQQAVQLRDAVTDNTDQAALTQSIKEVKFQLLQHDLANKSESELVENWNLYFEEAASLSRGEWDAALSLAVTLSDHQRQAAAELVLKSIADYFGSGRGDRIDQAPLVFTRLSELTLRILRDPREAAALAQQGLALLAAGNAVGGSAALRQRLLEGLTAAELAAAEAMLADKAVPELRAAIGNILARGAALGFANRFRLLRLVDRLFQEPLADLGGAIIGALVGWPPPEQGAQDRARRQGELYQRLSQASLRYLQAPEAAARLAQQGLDVLPEDADERTVGLRQRLLKSLSAARRQGWRSRGWMRWRQAGTRRSSWLSKGAYRKP